jgi:hypothetical protein
VAGLGAYTDLYHPLTRTRSDGPSSTDYTIGGCGGDSDNVTNEKGYSGGNGANGKIIIRIYYV